MNNKVVMYCRKSTEDKNKQINSIENQIQELKETAKRLDLEIIKTITDTKSAKDIGREGFNEMIELVRSGKANRILCWKFDRLARNQIDGGFILDSLQRGMIKEIITPLKIYDSHESSLILNIEIGMATQFVRDLSVNVMRGMKNKVNKGLYPGQAPLGYRNTPEKRQGERSIEVDPLNFPKVARVWELMLTGAYTVAQVGHIARNELKLCSKNGTPVLDNSLYRLLKNPFYYGFFEWSGDLYEGRHKPMISKKEFEIVQSHLSKGSFEKGSNLKFDYKGVFTCACCGCAVVGDKKKKFIKKTQSEKIYELYRCSHKKPNKPCKEPYLNKALIDEQVYDQLEKLSFPSAFFEWGIEELKRNKIEMEKTQKPALNRLQSELKALIKEKSTIALKYAKEIDSDVSKMLKDELRNTTFKIKDIEEEIERLNRTPKEEKKIILEILNFHQAAKEYFETGNYFKKKETLFRLGSNWNIKEKKVYCKANLATRRIQEVAQAVQLRSNQRKPLMVNKKPYCEDLILLWYTRQDSNL